MTDTKQRTAATPRETEEPHVVALEPLTRQGEEYAAGRIFRPVSAAERADLGVRVRDATAQDLRIAAIAADGRAPLAPEVGPEASEE